MRFAVANIGNESLRCPRPSQTNASESVDGHGQVHEIPALTVGQKPSSSNPAAKEHSECRWGGPWHLLCLKPCSQGTATCCARRGCTSAPTPPSPPAASSPAAPAPHPPPLYPPWNQQPHQVLKYCPPHLAGVLSGFRLFEKNTITTENIKKGHHLPISAIPIQSPHAAPTITQRAWHGQNGWAVICVSPTWCIDDPTRACARETSMWPKPALRPALLVNHPNKVHSILFFILKNNRSCLTRYKCYKSGEYILAVWQLLPLLLEANDDDDDDFLIGGGAGSLCPVEGGLHTEESRLPAFHNADDDYWSLRRFKVLKV